MYHRKEHNHNKNESLFTFLFSSFEKKFFSLLTRITNDKLRPVCVVVRWRIFDNGKIEYYAMYIFTCINDKKIGENWKKDFQCLVGKKKSVKDRLSRGFLFCCGWKWSKGTRGKARISSYKIMQNNNNMKTCTPLNTYEFIYHISKLSNVMIAMFWRERKMRHWKGKRKQEWQWSGEYITQYFNMLISFFLLKIYLWSLWVFCQSNSKKMERKSCWNYSTGKWDLWIFSEWEMECDGMGKGVVRNWEYILVYKID